MSIYERINSQMKEAMKAKDTSRLTALRGIRAAFLTEMKKDNSDELADDVCVSLLRRLEKQRKESIDAFEMDSASGPDAPSQGDTAWAIEAEGYALMLYTQGDSFVPMIKSGVCPTTDFEGNWVIARKRVDADATETDGDYFGSFAFDAATGQGSLPARHALSDGFPSAGAGTLDAGTCADGIMEVSDALMYLTDNGGAIVHTNLNDPDETSFIFALTQKSITSVAALDAEYAGILFDQSSASGSMISPVSIACTNGLCSGAFVTDVANNTTSGMFTVDLFGTTNDPITGFLTGTVTNEGGDSGNLACMVDEDVQGTGQRLLSCVGQAPGNNQRMFNLFFASSEQT